MYNESMIYVCMYVCIFMIMKSYMNSCCGFIHEFSAMKNNVKPFLNMA